MRRSTYLITAVAALLGFAACDQSPTDAAVAGPAAPRTATNVSTVCGYSSTPTGYVILSYGHSFSCGGSGFSPNSKTIGLPGSPETVCTSSTVPTGWVITSFGSYTSSCDPYANSSGLPRVTMTIKIPASPETVCTASTVPAGWVVTAYGSYTSSCDQYSNSSGLPRVTMTIKLPGTTEVVCSSSPVPSNYTIGAASWNSGCDRYNEGYRGFNNARQINRI